MERKKSFASRLREGMDRLNMNATELSEKTGYAKSTISQYRSGKYLATQDRVDVLAKVLGVSEGWLMGLGEDLTADEAALLAAFRRLEQEDKDYFMYMIPSMAESKEQIKRLTESQSGAQECSA